MARSNDDAAGMLQEFAELLALSGGPDFKVRVYEKAARSVAGHPADIEGLDEKALAKIPDVGSHTARKILEYFDTGAVGELATLRERVPPGLRGLLTVPGLGPQRAHQVHDELGITSVDGLLHALHQRRLRELRGWDEKSEDNLARSLRAAHSAGGRVQLGFALDLASELLYRISGLPQVRLAAYAGSLRRMRDTVGDVDLQIAAKDAAPIMDGRPVPGGPGARARPGQDIGPHHQRRAGRRAGRRPVGVGCGDALLHRLQAAQHPGPRTRAAGWAEAVGVRPVRRRDRQADRRRNRGRGLRAARPAVDPADVA